jgi:cytoplasmic iron level regulating protein YaaA (DUF328/UPF0246 family)
MKNNLVLCEIYHPEKYGIDEKNDKNIEKHYIVFYSYTYKGIKSFSIMKKDIKFIKKHNIILSEQFHPYIRNYNHINKNILNIQIAEKIILKGGECVAILKTFWIKIIQRTWKKVFRKYLFDKYLRELRGYKVLNRPNILRGMLK